MDCFECDGKYEKIVIQYELDTQYGKLSVPDVEVESCNKCGDDIIGSESLEKIDEAWSKLKDACARQLH
jgi:hypothetical protein